MCSKLWLGDTSKSAWTWGGLRVGAVAGKAVTIIGKSGDGPSSEIAEISGEADDELEGMLAMEREKNETIARARQRLLYQRFLKALGPDVGGLRRRASVESNCEAIIDNSVHRRGVVCCEDRKEWTECASKAANVVPKILRNVPFDLFIIYFEMGSATYRRWWYRLLHGVIKNWVYKIDLNKIFLLIR